MGYSRCFSNTNKMAMIQSLVFEKKNWKKSKATEQCSFNLCEKNQDTTRDDTFQKLASHLNKKQHVSPFYIISTNWFIVTVVSDLGNTVLKWTPLSNKRRITKLLLKHSINSDWFKQVNTTCEKYKMVLEKRFLKLLKQLSFRSTVCIGVNAQLYSRIFIDFEQGSYWPRISCEYNSSCSFSLPYFTLTIILRSP